MCESVFGAATRRLAAWLAETCPQAEIVLEPPGQGRAGATIHAFLLEIRPREMRSDRHNAVAEAVLRYAVAADGSSAEEAHELVGEVFAAAAVEAGMRVVGEPVAPEVWIAHGTAPRPCLQIEVPVRVEREIEHRWTVEHPLEVQVVDRERVAPGGAQGDGAGRRAETSDGEVDHARG